MILANAHRTLIIKIITILFILLFVYAATSKLLDYETFTVQLAQSPLLSAYAGILAWMVPGVEILISIFLMLPKYRIIALYASFLLMVMFTAYIVIILNFSDFVPCSCGGVLEKLSWGQHLVFNVGFIVLAVISVLIGNGASRKMKVYILVLIFIVGLALVSILFILSESKIRRNNGFIRRYPPERAVFNKAVDLHHNSWYLAGVDRDRVYLANSTAPLNIKVLDTTLIILDDYRIKLSDMNLPFYSVKVSVNTPYFYLADGMVPIIFRGGIKDWSGFPLMKDSIFFTANISIDSVRTGVRFVNGKTNENNIGIIQVKESVSFLHSDQILQKQVDGLFDTDGQLLFNEQIGRFIYIYFYRNEYLVFNTSLDSLQKGNTIDTTRMAKLKVSRTDEGETKLASPSFPVNTYASTYGDFLYVKSDRLGKYEPKEMLKEASIVDVYDVVQNTYEYSFYVYNYENRTMNSFLVYENKLWAIMDRYLVMYDLNM